LRAPILVTGGTGTLGRLVVQRLRNAGHDVRVLSRSGPEGVVGMNLRRDGVEYVSADLSTVEGVDAAVAGTEVILHLAGSSKGDEVKTQHLVDAAKHANVRHLVYISVVGADRVPMASAVDRMMFGYFGSKAASEQIIFGSGLPWTTLRATQFHDLTLLTARGMAKLPVVPAPSGFKFQPIDADEVAARLVELALGEPAGLVPEMGGPQVYEMSELVRSYLRATGKHRPIVPMKMPGRAARAFRDGANLNTDRAVGQRMWEEFLAERVGADRESAVVPA
jgi:uncharacterized protein YbjT (DUF2867 family)